MKRTLKRRRRDGGGGPDVSIHKWLITFGGGDSGLWKQAIRRAFNHYTVRHTNRADFLLKVHGLYDNMQPTISNSTSSLACMTRPFALSEGSDGVNCGGELLKGANGQRRDSSYLKAEVAFVDLVGHRSHKHVVNSDATLLSHTL